LRYLTLAALTFAALSCATAPQPTAVTRTSPPIWAGLTPGAYAVGFKSWLINPPALEFKNSSQHPIQMSVWYPAQDGGTPLRYSDYVLLSLSEKSAVALTPEQREAGVAEFMKDLRMGGVSQEHIHALADAAMYAKLGAPPLTTKKFPLVYIAQGNMQTASAQAVLAEYLASHGYVVATTPSITRETSEMHSDSDVGPKSAEQMDDIVIAVATMHDWPNVDASVPVALVGHSFGARGALMYATHYPTSALVSLEGGIGMATAVRSMLDSPVLNLNAQLPPVLHFYELNDPRVITDFRLLRSIRTPDLQLVQMKSMRHAHFSTDGFGAAMLPDVAALTKAAPGLRDDVVAYAEQTLAFIDKQTHRGSV